MERYRFHDDGTVFFTTFAVVEWLPVFVSEDACKIVVDSLNFCRRHENPCRKGLVSCAELWRFSSAGYWLSDGKVTSEVVLSAIEW